MSSQQTCHGRMALLACFFGAPALVVTAQQPPASIQGVVLDDNNQAVPGARVSAFGTQGARTSAQSITGQDGTFQLAGLAGGAYRICVSVPASDLLNPCTWEPEAPGYKLAAGQQTGLQIRVKRGARLRMRVEDPAGVLAANEGAASGVHLLMGVWTGKGIFYPAPVTSQDAAGREYSMAIPFDTPLKLTVNGRKLRMLDSTGKLISDRDPPIAVLSKRGEQPKVLQFQVAGLQN